MLEICHQNFTITCIGCWLFCRVRSIADLIYRNTNKISAIGYDFPETKTPSNRLFMAKCLNQHTKYRIGSNKNEYTLPLGEKPKKHNLLLVNYTFCHSEIKGQSPEVIITILQSKPRRNQQQRVEIQHKVFIGQPKDQQT